MIQTITSGSRYKFPDIDPTAQFAHQWDNNDISDKAHQVSNFLTYAATLGGGTGNFVLLSGPFPDDPQNAAQMRVDLSDWRADVQSATNRIVEVRESPETR